MEKVLFDSGKEWCFDPGQDMVLRPREKVFFDSGKEGSFDPGKDMVLRPRDRKSLLRSREGIYSFRSGGGRDFQSRSAKQILAKNMTWVSNPGPSILHTSVYLGHICSA